jgi:GAF domain-containing protein
MTTETVQITPATTLVRSQPTSTEMGYDVPVSSSLDWQARCIRVEEQRKLATAGYIMASSRNRDEVLQHIAREAFVLSIGVPDGGFTSIWLFSQNNPRDEFLLRKSQRDIATSGLPESFEQGGMPGRIIATYPPDRESASTRKNKSLEEFQHNNEGIIARALRTGETQLVEEVTADLAYVQSDERTRSEIVVPIKNDQRVFGVINIEFYQRATFTERTKRDMESLAAKAALPVEYALEHEDLERRVSANAIWATMIRSEVTQLRR